MNISKSKEGSTERLIQLCIGYFIFYVITGLAVKYFQGKPDLGFPGMSDIQYLVYSTIGGNAIALGVVLIFRWYKIKTNKIVTKGPLKYPIELLYIIPSGICTAVVIPATTLMYTLPISVMVAMVIMRGSIIIVSRFVDALQIKQGILKKKVYLEENIAVIFALLAVAIILFWDFFAAKFGEPSKGISFDFIHSSAAVVILVSYIIAYLIRIYIMNYYKNTRGKDVQQDNKGFFGIEQITASIVMLFVSYLLFNSGSFFNWTNPQLDTFRASLQNPSPYWFWAVISGTAFGAVAFFSVFIFMFKGRTATFAGLVNRLTSLIAGTASTLIFAISFKGSYPKMEDWISLAFILIAIAFISKAEKKRVAYIKREESLELKAAHA